MEFPDLRIHVLDHPDKVASFWRWLTDPERTYIAYDTETTGLNQYEPGFKVRMIQFGDAKGGWAIPFAGWRDLVEASLDWLSRARITQYTFNLAYDAVALSVEGIAIDYSVQVDVYVLARLGGFCDELARLKALGTRWLGPWAGVGEKVLHDGMAAAGWTWATVPMGWRPYPLYGCVDTCITALLGLAWENRLQRWRHMHDLEIATIEITARMTRIGMRVDTGYLAQQSAVLHKEEDELLARLGGYGVKPSERATVLKALQEAAVFPPDSLRTATGAFSVDQSVLSRIDHPVAADVLRWRNISHTRKVYLDGLLGFADSDSLVHAQIRPMEAKTSRMSIALPPLQQLPSEDLTVRRGVIPREDGHVIVTADYEQIELRLWAAMHKDTAMIAAINSAAASGVDFFTGLCRSVYQEPDFAKIDPRRKRVKSATYAELFDGTLQVAAKTAGVSEDAMLPTWVMLERLFPSLPNKLDVVRRGANGRGAYVMSPWDRRFAVQSAGNIRNLPNYQCQGSAAVTLKVALVRLNAAGYGDYMVVPVHDEQVFSVPEKDSAEAMHDIEQIMSDVIQEEVWGITVPAKPGKGDSWASAKAA